MEVLLQCRLQTKVQHEAQHVVRLHKFKKQRSMPSLVLTACDRRTEHQPDTNSPTLLSYKVLSVLTAYSSDPQGYPQGAASYSAGRVELWDPQKTTFLPLLPFYKGDLIVHSQACSTRLQYTHRPGGASITGWQPSLKLKLKL